MFAILETGGKQYKVEEGDILDVELLSDTGKNEFVFENILLIKNKDTLIGNPYIENAKIKAKVLEEIKTQKIIVFKKKSKKQYKKTQGHRQKMHRIQIEKIEIKASSKSKPKSAVKKEEKKEN